jgi:hypothetical protein
VGHLRNFTRWAKQNPCTIGAGKQHGAYRCRLARKRVEPSLGFLRPEKSGRLKEVQYIVEPLFATDRANKRRVVVELGIKVPVCEVAATVARGKDGLAAFRVAFEHDYLSAVLSRSDGGYNASGPTADYADVCVLRDAYTYRSVQAASLSLRTGFGSSARRHLKPLSMNHMKQRTNMQMKPRATLGASLVARKAIV